MRNPRNDEHDGLDAAVSFPERRTLTALATVGHYRELRDTDYTSFRRRLLRKKGGRTQVAFLEAVRAGNSAFLDYMSRVGRDGDVRPPALPGRLTESEFRMPPADTEQAVYRVLAGLSPATACRSAFWAGYTCDSIERDQIKAVYLAANGGDLSGGAARIDRVLRACAKNDPDASGGNDGNNDEPGQDGVGAKLVDDCVRTVLRRMGGIPEARGKRTVYVDCPFARAWWREWIVEEVAGQDEDIARLVGNVLRINQTYWEKIVDRIVSRNSSFGAVKVRRAFLLTLALEVESAREDGWVSRLGQPRHLIRCCRRVAAHQGMRELSLLGQQALEELMMRVLVERDHESPYG